ncbi:EAL domain-containing response regulator [Grimontia sp. NTOU-MAR1]|uniref:EAL domain-containing response regulator n=1 Tax=Grimontia sp. NTOU-MAR1 TaxID=3111011 RepID=UPI002DBB1824|nr:EAL domain-containing response regulator [Grimontia sp. NTOU-MAR1]WRV98480.1 EAL domain-containing response regulator [Grimontia sp. NTOU-MAR1]
MPVTRRILVVDDSDAILLMMKSILSDIGINKVKTFNNPKAALEELHHSPTKYDIVFTDLNMPGIDGMGVIRKLGNMKFGGGVCIISDLDVRVIELAAEVARQQQVCLLGNIAKPLTIETLQLILDRMDQFEERRFLKFTKMTKKELITSIVHHQIVPYYQPKMNPDNNRVDSLEVLARIQKPGETDAILPGRFIPTAIQYDLMDLLTIQLAEATALNMDILSQIFGDKVKISINLSPQQLADLEIPNRLEELFKSHDIDKSRVVLEITEEYALKSAEQMESLNRLRIRGFGLSLDDFGTGFTNLQQLRSLPFTEVKIDRTLISQIHQDQFSQVIVQSLSDITSKFNVDLVAEGIENFEELDYLSRQYPGILLQGFLICRPRPIEALQSWYTNWLKSVGANASADVTNR